MGPHTLSGGVDRFGHSENAKRASGSAEPGSVSEISGPNTFVLKKELIGEAIVGGFSQEHILRLFKDHSKTGIPETFHRLLADLGRKMGQIKVGGTRAYVTVKDPHLAREILAHRAVQALGPTPVADGVIVFAKAGVGDVIKLLKKMGHFPEG